jgi:hypothetical protein
LSVERFDAVGNGNPTLRTVHPDEGAWPEPTGIIKRAGFERKHVRHRLQNMIDADAAIRAEHTRNLTAAVSDTRKLSAIRVNCFVEPVTDRPSFLTGMDMPKALPDWRWHSVQWQAVTRIGSAVNT